MPKKVLVTKTLRGIRVTDLETFPQKKKDTKKGKKKKIKKKSHEEFSERGRKKESH